MDQGSAALYGACADTSQPVDETLPVDDPASNTKHAARLLRDLSDPLSDVEALLASRERADLPEVLHRSLDKYLQKNFRQALTKRATRLLHDRQPHMSALTRFSAPTRPAMLIIASILTITLLVAPTVILSAILGLLLAYCVASMALKALLTAAALSQPQKERERPECPLNLPIVTILLPVHNEGLALVSLVKDLEALDYPADKLDLKFLVEESDVRTMDALRSFKLPAQFEVLTIPKSDPQTKPKAMNYALPFVRGEIVGIYDAEDAPEPDQVRLAVATLASSDETTVCVQSRLNFYKATETVLSRMAQAEYTLWFDVLLKGLSRLHLPVPLGGTSLFIKTDALRAIDGWDPYNVTEDADLGLRLARRGWRAEVIDSTTWEEPPVRFKQWSGQRSRWIKGFMVTWLVHIRSPRALFRELGFYRAAAINVMLLDGFVAFLLQPFFWLALLSWLAFGASPWSSLLEPSMATLAVWAFAIGQCVLIVAAFIALKQRFGWARALGVPGLWLYWQFATLPAYQALREMFGNHAFWNKTEHGLSKAARLRQMAALQGR